MGIGLTEICLILLVALIVIKPEDLPKVTYKIGLWVRYFRNLFVATRHDIRREMNKDKFHD